jgi:CrcB protein
MESAYLLGTGGAIGAVLRYAVGEALPPAQFPWATLVVNVIGSFVLGLVAFGGVGEGAMLFVGVGACGSFTTFSSFSFIAVDLWDQGRRWTSALHVVGNLVGSLVAMGFALLLVQP